MKQVERTLSAKKSRDFPISESRLLFMLRSLDTDIFCYLCFVLLINYFSPVNDTQPRRRKWKAPRSLSPRVSRVPLIIYSPEPAGSHTTSIILTFKT